MQVKIRFEMSNGGTTDMMVEESGLVQLYGKMQMKKMFVVVDENNEFSFAINPRHLIRIIILEKKKI